LEQAGPDGEERRQRKAPLEKQDTGRQRKKKDTVREAKITIASNHINPRDRLSPSPPFPTTTDPTLLNRDTTHTQASVSLVLLFPPPFFSFLFFFQNLPEHPPNTNISEKKKKAEETN
jgi:hypothetical protein